MKSITTSIRLSVEMRQRGKEAAIQLHRGKNWIINEAINMYLNQAFQQDFAEEATRQSLLAPQHEHPEDDWPNTEQPLANHG